MLSASRFLITSHGLLLLAVAFAQPSFAQSPAAADQATVWKSITIGTHRSVIYLREALQATDCGTAAPTGPGRTPRRVPCLLGDAANEIVGRLELAKTPKTIELFLVSAQELGFAPNTSPSLREVYAQAEKAGYALCPPEAGPQLRLQYTNQAIGEFLLVAMRPIRNYDGDLTIFSVGNGGSGLSLVGGSGNADFHVPATKSFVFMLAPHVADDEVARTSD